MPIVIKTAALYTEIYLIYNNLIRNLLMIRSMTAYARYDHKSEYGDLVWELRAVNHRYLDIYIRLPDTFRRLESVFREKIRSRVTRGKIECHLSFKANENTQNELRLNRALAKQLINVLSWVKEQSKITTFNAFDLLQWPGVMISEDLPLEDISYELLAGLEHVLNDFMVSREKEGAGLKEFIKQRLKAMSAEIVKIRDHMPSIVESERERLQNKFEELKVQLDPNRLEQELMLVAQRMDTTEELDRLELHIKEIENILNHQDVVGRRLDFMVQECHRESNTLASKSINIEVTNSAVELKVLIEQIREQVQNIE